MKRIISLALLLAVVGSSVPVVADESDERAVEGFLNRLGLIDLQLLQLKRMVHRPGPRANKEKLAERLADLYAGQLMRSSEDVQRYKRLENEIRDLLDKFPKARTDLLEVQLLRADFNRAAALVGKWFDDPTQANSLTEADVILKRILPSLTRFEKALGKRAEQLSDRVDSLEASTTKSKLERELARVQAGVAQATFFGAWSSYYRGLVVLVSGTDSSPLFTQARGLFRRFVGISDSESYGAVSVADLGLEAEPKARAVIGLGQCEGALGKLQECLACFKLLQHESVQRAIRDEAPFRCVQGLLHVRRTQDAANYAKAQIDGFSKKATQGKVSLCVALVQAAYANKDNQTSLHKQLGALGINGLAKIGQFGAIRKLSDKYKFDLDENQGFYPCMIKGQQLLATATTSKKAADYNSAATLLEKALKFPAAGSDFASAGECHFQLGWCYLSLKKYVESGQHYEKAASLLERAMDPRAPESLWNAFVMYRKAMRSKPRYMSSAIEMLETLKRQFPRDPRARRVDYQIQRLRSEAGNSKTALRELMKIGPTDPTYTAARYDVVLLLHRSWKASKPRDAALAKQVKGAADIYLSLEKGSDERKLKCALTVVEVSLGAKPAQIKQAQTYLTRGVRFAGQLPPSNGRVVESRFWRLQLARRQNNLAEAKVQAEWLTRNAPGSAYELPALIIMAKSLESARKGASPNRRQDHVADLEKIYRRLVRHFGSSPSIVKSKRNAQVALSKLAFYLSASGKHGQASQHLDQLLAAYPNEKKYLRRSGLALFKSRKYKEALTRWRTLVRGNRSGTSSWYEAKFYQLSCLEQTNRGAAAKAYRQFKLLNPKLGTPEWRDRFAALGRRLR